MLKRGWQHKRSPEEDVISALLKGLTIRMDMLVLTKVLKGFLP